MTEAGIFTFNATFMVLIAITCAATGQWFGVIGSLLGAVNALAARWNLLQRSITDTRINSHYPE